MSSRPGYDDLAARRGRTVADEIVASAERYSDAAHQGWDVALRWAVEQHDRPQDADLVGQQEENARLYADLVERRGDASRPILYLVDALGGDAFDHPARLARAEAIYDTEGGQPPAGASLRHQLEWAAAMAASSDAPSEEP